MYREFCSEDAYLYRTMREWMMCLKCSERKWGRSSGQLTDVMSDQIDDNERSEKFFFFVRLLILYKNI